MCFFMNKLIVVVGLVVQSHVHVNYHHDCVQKHSNNTLCLYLYNCSKMLLTANELIFCFKLYMY